MQEIQVFKEINKTTKSEAKDALFHLVVGFIENIGDRPMSKKELEVIGLSRILHSELC